MSNDESLAITTITNGPFMENCYIVMDNATHRAIVIDPGDEPDRIVAEVKSLGATAQAVVATHGHIDHIGAVAPVVQALHVPFYMHQEDEVWAAHLNESAQRFGLPPKPTPTVDEYLEHGQVLDVGQSKFKILHTPGHTLGGCCLLFEDQKVVFVGDTLFAGSVGRTDLPGGSHKTLIQSIREQLLTLDDDVRVLSGHGLETTIGEERARNPFLQERNM